MTPAAPSVPALIHNKSTATQILQSLSPTLSSTGLDSATMRIAYWGGGQNDPGAACINAYLKSAAPGHSSMFCDAVDIEEIFCGWVTARLTFRGFYDDITSKPPTFNVEVGTLEQLFPFDVGGLTYNYGPITGSTYGVSGPGTGLPNPNNPNTSRPWRVSALQKTYAITRNGVDKGVPGTKFDPPVFSSPGNPPQEFNLGVNGVQDPLLHIPNGWVRTNFTVPNTELIGPAAFRFWQDVHLYVDNATR